MVIPSVSCRRSWLWQPVWRLVLTLVLLACGGLAWAEDNQIRAAAILRDEAGTLSITDVQTAEFRPVGNLVMAGYTAAAFWLRLTIDPAPAGEDTVLLIRPPTFDRITLYTADPSHPGQWTQAHLGGAVAIGKEELVSSLRGFRIRPAPGGTVYFVRLETTGSFTAHLSALPHGQAHRVGLMLDMAQITYMSLMMVLAVWSLRMAITTGESLFWWFAALQLGWIFHNVFHFGYVAILFPGIPQHAVFLTYRSTVIAVSALSIAFHRRLLRRFEPHWATLRLLEAMLVVMALAFVLFWIWDRTTALKINATTVALSPFAFFVTAFTTTKSASPGLRATRAIYAVLSGGLLLWVLTLLGLFEIGTFSLYGTMIHGAVTGVLMASILHMHGLNLLAEAQRAQGTLAALQERRALEQEQTRTLMGFIDMLTHEAKNALSVINMSVSAPRFGARQQGRVAEAIRDLTSVIDRCNQAVRLDSHEQRTHAEWCDPAAILREMVASHPAAERIALTAPDRAELRSDPVLLRVILSNLIENALKYSPPQSPIDILLTGDAAPVWAGPEKGGERVTITVANIAGPAGMPDPDRVFQKYYRSHRALSQIGSGLGLYLVQGLARLLGGGIAYEPGPDRVAFRLWLPC